MKENENFALAILSPRGQHEDELTMICEERTFLPSLQPYYNDVNSRETYHGVMPSVEPTVLLDVHDL